MDVRRYSIVHDTLSVFEADALVHEITVSNCHQLYFSSFFCF
jgi:hypothetical protein